MIPPLFALFSWPVIGLVLFRKLRLPLAVLVTLIGGFLLLPDRGGLNIPVLPSFDKHSIPALTALVLALILAGRDTSGTRPEGLIPRHPLALALLIVIPAGAVMTALTNTDTLRYGPTVRPGTSLYDAGSMASDALIMILPLLLARRYLADAAAQRLILQVLCIAALGYSLLVLFELRMSPQLSNWVYGFFPHDWLQHMRAGGWRPVVFMKHGLVLGIFLALSVLAIIALARLDPPRRKLWTFGAIWLFATLAVSNNLGALFIAVALLPVILFAGIRGQLLVAAIICGLILAYPVARTGQIVPYERVLRLAESVDPSRAASFQFRLDHEEQLLDKASERPLFGWGGWGRQRVYDDRGRNISVTDGEWIITLGTNGWVGYVARFGLLTAPILLLLLHRRRYEIGMETSALAIVLAANLVDLIPNSSNTPLTWLLAGALWGRLELQAAARTQDQNVEVAPADVGYRRGDPPEMPGDPQPAAPSVSTPAQNPYTRQVKRVYRKGHATR
ncbi:hypothetical protein [Aquicoccus sp.]|uniref:hypothetical protein n=1 Tax=Aquicoccus sp. TaxID=2055851 RepID=UPI003569A570